MELMLLSVLSPAVKCQWNLSSFEEAIITSVSKYLPGNYAYTRLTKDKIDSIITMVTTN